MELIQDAAQGPEIGGVVIGLFLHQLRGHVEWRALYRGQHQSGHTHSTGKAGKSRGSVSKDSIARYIVACNEQPMLF